MMLPTLETRVADHETRISMNEAVNAQINERLNSMDNRLNSMDNRLEGIDNRLNSMIKWLIGLLCTMLMANIGTAIALLNLAAKP